MFFLQKIFQQCIPPEMACVQLCFSDSLSVVRDSQKRKDDRRTNREVSPTIFAVASIKHGYQFTLL